MWHVTKEAPPKRGQVDPHHKDAKVSVGGGVGGTPVVALGDLVFLADQGRTPVHQRHKDRC